MGVEGISEEVLEKILRETAQEVELCENEQKITKAILYEDGLSGRDDSEEKRRKLKRELGLPLRLSSNPLIDILNSAIGFEQYKKAIEKIKNKAAQ